MIYSEIRPSPRLLAFVECYWYLAAESQGAWQAIYPDGCSELILNLGEPSAERRGDTVELQPRYLVYGQIDQRIHLRSAARTDVISVRLRPWGATALLGVPGFRLAGKSVALDAVAPELAARVIAIVEAESPVDAKIALLDDCLWQWVRDRDLEIPASGRVAHFLQRTPTSTVRDLTRLTGWSTRTAQRRFRTEVGLSPKRFQQITRFLRLLRLFEAEPTAPLAELAVAAGYYDQPHLHRDLGRFVGATPNAFRARRPGTFDPLYGRARLERLVAI